MKIFEKPALFLFYFVLILIICAIFYSVGMGVNDPHTSLPIQDAQEYPDSETVWNQLKNNALLQPFNIISLVIFICAIIHIFLCHKFTQMSERIRERNIRLQKPYPDTFIVELLHFMGEIEIVFAIWVIPLMIAMSYFYNWSTAIKYLNGVDYTEPLFVLVIMALSSTKPITDIAENLVSNIAKIGGGTIKAWWFSILTFTPLLGSLITEPASMTIAAILLTKQFYTFKPSFKLSYATLGLLFTNISVGGVLTNFAAPPVLLVVKAWNWSTYYMFVNFGLKAVIGILIANVLYYFIFRNEFTRMQTANQNEMNNEQKRKSKNYSPFWLSLIHAMFLAWVVIHLHYPVIFVGSFLLFIGFYQATRPYQNDLELKTPLLVGLFLAGLIIHGNLQGWWLTPLLQNTNAGSLMLLSMVLSAFNDNAGVTYLATLIPNFSAETKYAIVSGAVAGGGLTVIANAPNLAGQSILTPFFDRGVSALYLFLGALLPTAIMAACFYFIG